VQVQRQILERGDIEEGLGAADAVGDDRLQQMSGGGVHPESFTRSSSEQRMRWFRKGLQSDDSSTCDTFATWPCNNQRCSALMDFARAEMVDAFFWRPLILSTSA
jgi:hypothetical protein